MSDVFTFLIYAVLWELLLVGVPVVVGVVALWRWWRRLPSEERTNYRFGRGSTKTAGGSGGVSFLLFLIFAIKVYLDGRWNVPISTFTLDYVVGSTVLILLVGLILIGIPAAVAVVWWLSRHD